MRFGLLYLPTYVPELDGPVADLYERMLGQMEAAEELGFHDAWITEHHFTEYGATVPDPTVFLAAMALRTRRLRIGVAVSVLPLRNPVQLAESYAMVDVLSGGRLEVGIGRGSTALEFERFGISNKDSAVRTRESTDVILRAWADEPLTFHGEIFDYEDVPVLPKPIQRPHPPIWVGATRTPESFEWAGRNGFHLMTLPYMFEPSDLGPLIDLYRGALKESGYDLATHHIEGKFHAYVAPTDAAAKDALPYLLNYRRVSDARDPRLPDSLATYDYDRQVERGNIIFGSPGHCIKTIERWRELLGLTAVSCTFHFGGMPQDMTLDSIRRFANEVMPAF